MKIIAITPPEVSLHLCNAKPHQTLPMQDFLFVKDGSSHQKIFLDELVYVKAIGRYVRMVTCENKIYTSKCYLSEVELSLPSNEFCRIHRSFIVALRHVEKFTATEALVGGTQVPIGRHYRRALQELVRIVSPANSLSRAIINDIFNKGNRPHP